MDVPSWSRSASQYVLWCETDTGNTVVKCFPTESSARAYLAPLAKSREDVDLDAPDDKDDAVLIKRAVLVEENHAIGLSCQRRSIPPGTRITRRGDIPRTGEFHAVWNIIWRDGHLEAIGRVAGSAAVARAEVLADNRRGLIVDRGHESDLLCAVADHVTARTIATARAIGNRLVRDPDLVRPYAAMSL